jgi:hypothetical protein
VILQPHLECMLLLRCRVGLAKAWKELLHTIDAQLLLSTLRGGGSEIAE